MEDRCEHHFVLLYRYSAPLDEVRLVSLSGLTARLTLSRQSGPSHFWVLKGSCSWILQQNIASLHGYLPSQSWPGTLSPTSAHAPQPSSPMCGASIPPSAGANKPSPGLLPSLNNDASPTVKKTTTLHAFARAASTLRNRSNLEPRSRHLSGIHESMLYYFLYR